MSAPSTRPWVAAEAMQHQGAVDLLDHPPLRDRHEPDRRIRPQDLHHVDTARPLNPSSTHAVDTVGVCATTRSINCTLSVAEAAITTTAMINPNTSTARPRLRHPLPVMPAPA